MQQALVSSLVATESFPLLLPLLLRPFYIPSPQNRPEPMTPKSLSRTPCGVFSSSALAAKEMIEFDPPDMLSAPLTKLFLQAKQLCIKLKHIQEKGIIPKGRLGEVLDWSFCGLGSGLGSGSPLLRVPAIS